MHVAEVDLVAGRVAGVRQGVAAEDVGLFEVAAAVDSVNYALEVHAIGDDGRVLEARDAVVVGVVRVVAEGAVLRVLARAAVLGQLVVAVVALGGLRDGASNYGAGVGDGEVQDLVEGVAAAVAGLGCNSVRARGAGRDGRGEEV